MTTTYAIRAEQDYAAEQKFLNQRVLDIETGLGVVAARTSAAAPIPPRLEALSRARELTLDMYKQVRVRPMEEAILAQLAWLDEAESRMGKADGEPKVGYSRIALDRRLLTDLLELWRAQKN